VVSNYHIRHGRIAVLFPDHHLRPGRILFLRRGTVALFSMRCFALLLGRICALQVQHLSVLRNLVDQEVGVSLLEHAREAQVIRADILGYACAHFALEIRVNGSYGSYGRSLRSGRGGVGGERRRAVVVETSAFCGSRRVVGVV
jgi:hypothetical protein